jgi:hypothetical protein
MQFWLPLHQDLSFSSRPWRAAKARICPILSRALPPPLICALFRRARARPTLTPPPMLTAVRESGKPFALMLNQVQARSTRLYGAAGSLGKRAIELKMAHVLGLPAIVLRNYQQDALGIGLSVTEFAPRFIRQRTAGYCDLRQRRKATLVRAPIAAYSLGR